MQPQQQPNQQNPDSGVPGQPQNGAPSQPGLPNGAQGAPGGAVPGVTQRPAERPVRNPNSTQNALLLAELRDGLAVMNDGSFRAVIACKSINFDLMSEREREGVEFSYQSFLNSLYFPVQILIRSQRVDIGPYIERLDKIRRSQDNMLLGVLMDDYINFIAMLSEQTNIMDKSFFVVVPYYITGDINNAVAASKNMMSSMLSPQKQMHITIDQATYGKAKDELANRVNTVLNGLYQIGIRAVQLNTKELGELYYNAYNPDTAVREPLGDFENLTAAVIAKGPGQAAPPHMYRENL